MLSLVVCFNFSKFWGDYIFSINHQVFTGLQIVTLLLFCVAIQTGTSKLRHNLIGIGFVSYHVARLVAEVCYQVADDFKLEIVIAATYSTLRAIIIYYLYLVLKNSSKFNLNANGLKNVLLIYLVYTTFFSIAQLPYMPTAAVTSLYGGNFTSGNHLGFSRSNGGLGGTVIMYTNFLIFIAIMLSFTSFKKKYVSIFFKVIILVAGYLCFSRIFFLVLSMLWVGILLRKNPVIAIILVVSVIGFISSEFHEVISLYFELIGNSDEARLRGWNLMLAEKNLLEHLFGVTVGANTGLITGDMYKMNGDGFILSYLYDFGVVGVISLLILIYDSIKSAVLVAYDRLLVFACVFCCLFVNSGFEKIFIVSVFFSFLLVIKIQYGLTCSRKSVSVVQYV